MCLHLSFLMSEEKVMNVSVNAFIFICSAFDQSDQQNNFTYICIQLLNLNTSSWLFCIIFGGVKTFSSSTNISAIGSLYIIFLNLMKTSKNDKFDKWKIYSNKRE